MEALGFGVLGFGALEFWGFGCRDSVDQEGMHGLSFRVRRSLWDGMGVDLGVPLTDSTISRWNCPVTKDAAAKFARFPRCRKTSWQVIIHEQAAKIHVNIKELSLVHDG